MSADEGPKNLNCLINNKKPFKNKVENLYIHKYQEDLINNKNLIANEINCRKDVYLTTRTKGPLPKITFLLLK